MYNEKLLKKLSSLAQLDADAYHAYGQAIERIREDDIKNRLIEYRADHERHYRELSAIIEQNRGKAPDFSPDLKGYLIEGMTAMRSATNTKGALKAMRSNEKTTNKRYTEMTSDREFPEEVLVKLRAFHDDERRHLEFVEQQIKRLG